MLKHTFCHVPGIGEATEGRLWLTGITSWELAVRHASFRQSWVSPIQESIGHYEKRNVCYFAENLPSNQHWRLYWDFRDACAFVDIETTGFWPGEITTAVVYDGRAIRYYVNGVNLDELPRDLKEFALLVTYNGKTFDVPFINRFFGICLPQAHIDLRYLLGSLGLKGGLKGCERQLGHPRPGLENVDGFFAVLLWQEYRRRRNIKALETLLAYNIRDTLSLHSLMVHAHNQKVKATPFSESYFLPTPLLPKVPFEADRIIVELLCRSLYGGG
jgi:uncharacterized protein YprB with RNaseH-like and TPR domain